MSVERYKKEGTKVLIKNDLGVRNLYDGCYLAWAMRKYKGTVKTIKNWGGNGYTLEESEFNWSDEMIHVGVGDRVKIINDKGSGKKGQYGFVSEIYNNEVDDKKTIMVKNSEEWGDIAYMFGYDDVIRDDRVVEKMPTPDKWNGIEVGDEVCYINRMNGRIVISLNDDGTISARVKWNESNIFRYSPEELMLIKKARDRKEDPKYGKPNKVAEYIEENKNLKEGITMSKQNYLEKNKKEAVKKVKADRDSAQVAGVKKLLNFYLDRLDSFKLQKKRNDETIKETKKALKNLGWN